MIHWRISYRNCHRKFKLGSCHVFFKKNGDDAYACSDHMVTPYPGRKQSADRDGFNYWQSKDG